MMALLLAALLLPGRRLRAPGAAASRESWGGRMQRADQRRLAGSGAAGAGRWEGSLSREKPGEDAARGKGRSSGV